jgi:hypothetical protein
MAQDTGRNQKFAKYPRVLDKKYFENGEYLIQ